MNITYSSMEALHSGKEVSRRAVRFTIPSDPNSRCSVGTYIISGETLYVDALWLWNDVALNAQQIARLYQWPVVWSASPQHVVPGTSVVTLSGTNLAYNPVTGAAVPPLSMLLSGAGSNSSDVSLCSSAPAVLSSTQMQCTLSSDASAVLLSALSLQQPSLSYAVRFSRAGIVPGNSISGSSALLLSTSVQLSSASACDLQPCDLTSACNDTLSGYGAASGGTQYVCSAPVDGTLVLPAPAWSLTFDNPAAPPSSYFTVVTGAAPHYGVGEFSADIVPSNGDPPNMDASTELAAADAGVTSLPAYGGGSGALTVSAWALVTATSNAYILDCEGAYSNLNFGYSSGQFKVYVSSNTLGIFLMSLDVLSLQEWHLVTFSSSSSSYHMYIDEIEVQYTGNDSPIAIQSDSTAQYFIGTNIMSGETLLVDVLWLWNDVALNAQQIARLYQWPVVWSASPQHVLPVASSQLTLSGANLAYNPVTGLAVPPLSVVLDGPGSNGTSAAAVRLCASVSVLSPTQLVCNTSSAAIAGLAPYMGQAANGSYSVLYERAALPANSSQTARAYRSAIGYVTPALVIASACAGSPCPSASMSGSVSASKSISASGSASASISATASASASASVSTSTSASGSASPSVSGSASTSASASASASGSASDSVSLSGSASGSNSVSTTVSASASVSYTASASASYTECECECERQRKHKRQCECQWQRECIRQFKCYCLAECEYECIC